VLLIGRPGARGQKLLTSRINAKVKKVTGEANEDGEVRVQWRGVRKLWDILENNVHPRGQKAWIQDTISRFSGPKPVSYSSVSELDEEVVPNGETKKQL
jgi:hypothetical protein